MLTRMQQRRGTSTQWVDANPILGAGEIGFELETTDLKLVTVHLPGIFWIIF